MFEQLEELAATLAVHSLAFVRLIATTRAHKSHVIRLRPTAAID